MKTLVSLLLLNVATLCSQNIKQDLAQINENYSALEKMSMHVTYELYFDNDKASSEQENGLYKRDKNRYFLKQAGNELLITENHMIVVDHESKTIIVELSQNKVNPLDPLSLNLDSILNFYETTTFYKTGKDNELSAYTFKLKRGPYSSIDIVFDPKKMLVREIINTYREKMPDDKDQLRTTRLKTVFSNYKTDPFYLNDFNESKYVVTSKNRIMPTRKYSTYKLLTNLKTL